MSTTWRVPGKMEMQSSSLGRISMVHGSENMSWQS
jgi:hypothetical protein